MRTEATPSLEMERLFAAGLLFQRRVTEDQLRDVLTDRSNDGDHSLIDLMVDNRIVSEEDWQNFRDSLRRRILSDSGTPQSEATDIHKLLNLAVGKIVDQVTDFDVKAFLTEGKLPGNSEIGQHFDATVSYELIREFASGGLGSIWLVREDQIQRDLALKRMRPEVACHPELRRRFLREARITGELDHPNIVTVHVLGHQGNEPFYTMRLLKGRTLAEVIQDQPRTRKGIPRKLRDLNRLLSIFRDVCNAVAYAHSQSTIHRDLKPSNVMVGDYGEVSLLDWGLAKRLDEHEHVLPTSSVTEPSSLELTISGTIVGSPSHMSPEQASGQIELLGPAVDVYGLGAILYSILTGRDPHQRMGGESAESMISRIRNTPPPPPRKINPAAPPGLEAICLRAMAMRPSDRYPSVTALMEDIDLWLGDEPISVYRESFTKRVARWSVRRRWLSQFIGVFFVALAITAATLSTYYWVATNALVERELRELRDTTNYVSMSLQRNIDICVQDTRVVSEFPVLQFLIKARQKQDVKQQRQWTDLLASSLRNIVRVYEIYVEGLIVTREGENIVTLSTRVSGDDHPRIDVSPAKVADEEMERLRPAFTLPPDGVFVSRPYIESSVGMRDRRSSVVMDFLAAVREQDHPRPYGATALKVSFAKMVNWDDLGPQGPLSATVYIADETGHYLAHPDPLRSLGATNDGEGSLMQEEFPPLSPLFERGNDRDSIFIRPPESGDEVIYASKLHYAPGDHNRYFVIGMAMPYHEVLSAPVRNSRFIAPITLGATALLIVLGLVFAQTVARAAHRQ
ncbi:Serine/threonine-protein kinase PknD [Planctomycetes bacterium Pan216]|uniref:Serine/threonine-protein kinase PknD n=1 Tax=Kolteria novifilia TaxID=2527975 RepID=A0A518B1P5_9BACT|nr:Serine/threonine-protein kinase PknD [Planctomycetes bacterium Pan216]